MGVVIPTLNAAAHIERLLLSIRAQSYSSYSIAVVDQNSTDRTTDIARSYGCTVVNVPRASFYSPPALSRNLGAQSVQGTILLHLDADMELSSPEFLSRLVTLIDRSHQAIIIHEEDVAQGFWATCKAIERSCYRGTKMEAARAVTRELFARVGGYDEGISSGEDFYITRLYESQTEVITDPSLALRHHVGRFSLGSQLRKKFAYGRTSTAYLHKTRGFGAGAIIWSSIRAYLANWRLLGRQPVHYLCIFPLRAMEFAAVQLGMRVGPKAKAAS